MKQEPVGTRGWRGPETTSTWPVCGLSGSHWASCSLSVPLSPSLALVWSWAGGGRPGHSASGLCAPLCLVLGP